jgi:hypothetical protein
MPSPSVGSAAAAAPPSPGRDEVPPSPGRARFSDYSVAGLAQALREGAMMLKFPFAGGKPELRFVFVDLSTSEPILRWRARKSGRFLTTRSLSLGGLNLVYGPQSYVFQRKVVLTVPWRCFSLVSERRTVDFQADTDAELEHWILGLQMLLAPPPPGQTVWSRGLIAMARLRMKLQSRHSRWHEVLVGAVRRAAAERLPIASPATDMFGVSPAPLPRSLSAAGLDAGSAE